MKIYLITTGVVFALLFFAHVARVFVEGTHPLTEPIFIISTIASILLCVWAAILLRRLTKNI